MDIKTITGKTPVFKQSFKEMISEAAPSWDKEYMEGHTYADVYRVVYAASKDGTVNIDKTSFTGNELTGIPKGDLLAVVRNRFEKWGLTAKANMGVYSITTFGIAEGKKLGPLTGKTSATAQSDIASGSEEDEANLAAGVADISKLKQRIFKIPNVSSGSKFTTQMGNILTHMESFAAGLSKTTMMITSDPGTGKTSAIKALSTLTGIPLLVIEAPSIVSETIINIPYLVIDGPKTREGNVEVESSSMSIVQAESNIITQIKSMKQRDPDFIEKQIQRNPQLKAVAEHLSYELQAIKGKYKCILFIDEYFRTSSPKIRNILRNILNGSLGCWCYEQEVEVDSSNIEFMNYLKERNEQR